MMNYLEIYLLISASESNILRIEEIITLAKEAKTSFLLQTGFATGYIYLLVNGIFTSFVETLQLLL